jgi:hypothetical protein
MLTKTHKIVIGAGLCLIVLVVGALLYYQLVMQKSSTQNTTQTTQATSVTAPNEDNNQSPNVDVALPDNGIQYTPGNGGGTLTICQDKCGDGICQAKDATCPSGDLNCACAETKQECPQDCK